MGIEDIGKQVSPRFQIVNAVPIASLVGFLSLLALSGAVGGKPSLRALRQAVGELRPSELLAGTFLVFILALAVNAAQTRLVKILEGYWRPSGPWLMLTTIALDRHRRQRRTLGEMRGGGPDARPLGRWQTFWLSRVPPTRREELEFAHRRWLGDRHDQYPPETDAEEDDRLMPTRLGNVLRRYEDLAGDRYGLDAVALAPHLLSVATADMVSVYEDARTELDVAVKLVYAWGACTVIGLLVLFDDGPWLLLPLATFMLSYTSYRAAVVAAAGLGEALLLLVDLHRFDLVRRLHWPLPDTPSTERSQLIPLWQLIAGEDLGPNETMRYDHRRLD